MTRPGRSPSTSQALTSRAARSSVAAPTEERAANVVLNQQGKHRIPSVAVRKFLAQLLGELQRPSACCSVVFITDDAMRTYNRTYRGFDKPTDVLSFEGDDGYLGDILISTETAYNQALKSPTLTFETNI